MSDIKFHSDTIQILLNTSSKKQIETINKNDILSNLNRIRNKNLDKLVGGNLNINSPIPKYYELKPFLIAKVDIIIISEIKLEETFSSYIFPIKGFYNKSNWMKTVMVVV